MIAKLVLYNCPIEIVIYTHYLQLVVKLRMFIELVVIICRLAPVSFSTCGFKNLFPSVILHIVVRVGLGFLCVVWMFY
jgi:hypothetical protein